MIAFALAGHGLGCGDDDDGDARSNDAGERDASMNTAGSRAPDGGAMDGGRDPQAGRDAGDAGPDADACRRALEDTTMLMPDAVECVCDHNSIAMISACDDDCWNLLRCEGAHCSTLPGDDQRDPSCIAKYCGDYLDEAEHAEALNLQPCLDFLLIIEIFLEDAGSDIDAGE